PDRRAAVASAGCSRGVHVASERGVWTRTSNETPSWYAQADRRGTYNRRNRNKRLDAARLCRHGYERDVLAGSVTTICFHSAFCPQAVSFPAYAYQESVSLEAYMRTLFVKPFLCF